MSNSVNRGRGRGRGGGGAWGSSSSSGANYRRPWNGAHTSPPVATTPYGDEIDSVNIATLLIEERGPTIQNLNYVASYNWVDSTSPIILVPGSPPAWSPPSHDEKLPQDSPSLKVYRDINAARNAKYPMEPAIRSVLALEPDFDIHNVDLVACGSTVGNLLRFANSVSKPFRFDVDRAEDTVFFIRKERTPTETIDDLRGYGHTFPERYTTWDKDVGGSCSHQRIIEYDFGGLHFMIRSETDGYVKQEKTDALGEMAKPQSPLSGPLSNVKLGTLSSGPGPFYNVGPSNFESSLSDLFGQIGLSNTADSTDGKKLQLRMQGKKAPQSQIFDIKTRASTGVFDMEELLPRLWVNQTPKFLIAYHKYGVFDKPEVSDVKQQVVDWEKENANLLSRFHALVKRILDIVRDSDEHRVEVSWDGQGPLRVTKQIGQGNRVLPQDLLQKWEDA